MLHPENASTFLDGLAQIRGILKIVVHGPAYNSDLPGRTLSSCVIQPPEYSEVTISGRQVELHVLTGDVMLEYEDYGVLSQVDGYCAEFFKQMPYLITVGKCIKTDPSLSDYVRGTQEVSELLGLADSHHRIEPVILPFITEA